MSLLQEYELLRRVPFFAEIEPARLKLLAFMSERVGFDPGKALCRQGDPADAAYLIIEGEADILVDTPSGPLTIATLGANDIVGEMAILGDVPRTATVQAKDPDRRAAHRQGAVHAHGARIPDDGGVDHARAGAPARTDQQPAAQRAVRGQAVARGGCPQSPCGTSRGLAGGMSRLDSFIRRLEAQRACLNRAAELIRDIDGFVLELGLGNGRTYDHLRELFPDRDILRLRTPRRGPPGLRAAAGAADPRRHARHLAGGASAGSAGGSRSRISTPAPATPPPISPWRPS